MLLVVLCAGGFGGLTARAQDGAGPQVAYTVEFKGLPGGGIQDLFESASQLVRLKDSPPASVLGLRRRLRADAQRLNEILRSEGYYGARVVPAIERPAESEETSGKTTVTLTVLPGTRYVFTAPDVLLDPGIADSPEGYADPIRALEGKPARAAAVIAAERAVVGVLANNGYPFARVLPRTSEVDHARTGIMITARFDAGAYHDFGSTEFTGLDTVEDTYLNRLLTWQPGEPFDRGVLNDYRQSLIDTRLFTSVKVEPKGADTAPAGAPLNIAVSVNEGLHRTLGAYVKYARDEGAGVGASWQHRNFFGQGETFDAKAEVSELRQLVSTGLTKPAFRRPDQVLSTGLSLLHEDNDAFEEYSATVSAGVERDLWQTWRGGIGVSLEAAELTDANGTDQSYLVGLPLTLSLDKTESLLDPKDGYRLLFEVTPYAGQFSGTALFTRAAATASYYYPLSDTPRPIVLAARLKIGSVIGERSAAVPANKRFYAGGGGSVRGFGYQLIGPLDADNNPRGGRSVIETGLEARIPVTDTISVVPFLDGGIVSQDVVPALSETFRMGAGLGGRYDTPVGPLRVDVAIPVNRRSGIDNGFQFYISFGQAF